MGSRRLTLRVSPLFKDFACDLLVLLRAEFQSGAFFARRCLFHVLVSSTTNKFLLNKCAVL